MSEYHGDDDRTESVGNHGNEPDRPRIERLGQFKIEGTLGSGGMGTIYRAFDDSMKRPVALKVLHTALEISEQAQTRFVREAWIAGQLDHPNIVKVYSRGEENKVSYLAMELVDGGSLHDYIERTRESIPSGSDVTATIDRDYINDILGKFIELANALEHIHNKGFIHRDIKPHNVMLSGEERKFKFTDFGIAHAQDMTRMTRAGDFIGTIKYMSPELLAAHRAGIDKRTDIYSLGVTLYEALTLTLPFKADSEEKLIGEILAGHYNEARKNNRRIPVDLETVLMKACNHDPDQRYQGAAELADDLQRIIDGRPILAKRPGLVTKCHKYLCRNYRTVLGFGAAAVIVLFAILWAYYKVEQAQRDTSEQQQVIQPRTEPKFTKIEVPGLTEYCALSPDGEEIAFVAEDSCLWLVPTHGRNDPTVAGEPVRLTEPIFRFRELGYPTWSANGKWIAFNARGTQDSAWNKTLSVFVISSSGGEPKEIPIQQYGSGRRTDYRLSLSPDGEQLAFSSDSILIPGNSKSKFIYVVQLDGGGLRRLTNSHSSQPSFSPNGEMIAYVQGKGSQNGDQGSNQSEVCVIPLIGGEPIKIASMTGKAVSPIWSPDSKMIAFGVWNEHTDLRNDPYYKELHIVRLSANYQPIGSPTTVKLPRNSNNLIGGWTGKNQIALVLTNELRGGVYKILASGGVATQVTSSNGYSPRWSPDGETIIFMDDSAIYSVPSIGGLPTRIPIIGMREVSYANCDISPDGKRLTIAGVKERDSSVSVFTVPVIGGKPTQMVFGPQYSGYPCWSPDGKWIAFGRGRPSETGEKWITHLSIISSEGGNFRDLVSSLGEGPCKFTGEQMAWSPDGKYIAYPSFQNDSTGGISIIPLDGGDPELLIQLEPKRFAIAVSWSPDGSKIAYCDYNKSTGDGSGVKILPLKTRVPFQLRTGLDFEEVWMISWSPDGEKIAFASHWLPERDLYLMEDFLPAITIPEPELKKEPIFSMINVPGLLDYCALSPDGKRIAYASDSFIWVAPTKGVVDSTVAGEPVIVAGPMNMIPLIGLPTWSADGRWIAFNGNVEVVRPHHIRASMFIVPSSGGEILEVPVAHDGKDAWNCFRIGLSPDGERIAFSSFTSPIPGDSSTDFIYSMPVAGGEIVKFTDSLCRQPVYSPDGNMLAYVRGHQKPWGYDSLQSDIWVVPVDGGTPSRITNLPGREFSPVWSPDSRAIAFFRWAKLPASGYGFPELYITELSEDFKPTGVLSVVNLPLPSDDFIGGWSTENEIGLVAESEPFAAVFTVSASGGLASQITPSVSWQPCWSPDGERLFYQSSDRKIHSVAAMGGPVFTVPITGKSRVSALGLDVSPDGLQLALVGVADRDSTRDIFMVPVKGGELVPITSGSDHDWFPEWSPDGKWIAFDRVKELRESLCVVPAMGGKVRELVGSDDSTGYSGYPVSWSPDSRFIAFTSYINGSRRCLSVVPLEGGDTEVIVEFSPDVICNSVSWSPDGKQLAYCTQISEYGGTSSAIWIMDLDEKKPYRLRFGHNLDIIESVSWSPDGKTLVFGGERIQDNTLYLIKNFLPDK